MEPGTRAAVLTVSDGVTDGTREDASGDAAAALLREAGFDVSSRRVVPDERPEIEAALRELAAANGLVVTTGGTGFGPRDVTPEATRAVIEREAPGVAELMRASGLAQTPMAALSRGVAGAVGSALILNLPGSPKGVRESLAAVLPVIPHAVELLGGATGAHPGVAAGDRGPLGSTAATSATLGRGEGGAGDRLASLRGGQRDGDRPGRRGARHARVRGVRRRGRRRGGRDPGRGRARGAHVPSRGGRRGGVPRAARGEPAARDRVGDRRREGAPDRDGAAGAPGGPARAPRGTGRRRRRAVRSDPRGGRLRATATRSCSPTTTRRGSGTCSPRCCAHRSGSSA